MELDVPALKTGGRLSVLVILSHTSRHGRVARTGRACVTSVQKLLGTAIRQRLGATRADLTGALTGRWGVRL